MLESIDVSNGVSQVQGRRSECSMASYNAFLKTFSGGREDFFGVRHNPVVVDHKKGVPSNAHRGKLASLRFSSWCFSSL